LYRSFYGDGENRPFQRKLPKPSPLISWRIYAPTESTRHGQEQLPNSNRSSVSERLRDFMRSKAILRQPLEFSGVEQQAINGISFTVCIFHAPQKSDLVQVLLANDGGQWRVERLLVGS